VRGRSMSYGAQPLAQRQRRLGAAALAPRPVRDLLRGEGCCLDAHEVQAPTLAAMQLLADAGAGTQQHQPQGSQSTRRLSSLGADGKTTVPRHSKAPQREGLDVQRQAPQVQPGEVDGRRAVVVSLTCLGSFGGGNLIVGLSNGVCCVVQLQAVQV
jgi:hypothetical protein